MYRDRRTQLIIRETELIKDFRQGNREHASELIDIQKELNLQENRVWFANGETRYVIIHADGTVQKGTLFRIQDEKLYTSLGVFDPKQRTQFYEVRDYHLSRFADEQRNEDGVVPETKK